MEEEGREMERPTYKGRRGGKREREGLPVITVSPGSRGARIVIGEWYYTFKQDSAPAHRARENIELLPRHRNSSHHTGIGIRWI